VVQRARDSGPRVARYRSSTEGRASAYDVYAKPLTAYVACFIGSQNVLGAGSAPCRMEGSCSICQRTGELSLQRRIPAPPTGSTLHVSVRRDRIHLAKQKPVGSPNAVSGKVRAIEYQGTL
jgi:ABC-type Fe3+/spermidine/putrescine transport system ATPase subunit